MDRIEPQNEADPAFHRAVSELLRLRREIPLLRQARYVHGRVPTDGGWCDIGWLHPDGRPMRPPDWNSSRRLALVFSVRADQKDNSPVIDAVAILFNATDEAVEFALPYELPGGMAPRFSSTEEDVESVAQGRWSVAARSLLLLASEDEP